ncbi:MAG: SH3 domain-containing protein [Chloroflexi bacterium]|nr:SH3 domain-containing protein [Chloroflexota bacterium]
MGCWAVRRGLLAGVTALAVVLSGAPAYVLAVEYVPTERPGNLTPSQLFSGRSLTPREAQAACGPAAAVAFARAVGRTISLDTAVAVAREVGWTPTYGMTGPWGQLSLLTRLKIPATLEVGVNQARIVRELQAGRPVIIRTGGRGTTDQPGHYFVAERYDAASGKFDLAQSAMVLRSAAGRRWFSMQEIGALGTGVPTHTLFLSPASATASAGSGVVAAMSVRPATPIGVGSLVVETGGLGARLRAAPGTDGRIVTVVADGTRLVDGGATQTVAGRVWQKVISGGTVAWIDSGLLK